MAAMVAVVVATAEAAVASVVAGAEGEAAEASVVAGAEGEVIVVDEFDDYLADKDTDTDTDDEGVAPKPDDGERVQESDIE